MPARTARVWSVITCEPGPRLSTRPCGTWAESRGRSRRCWRWRACAPPTPSPTTPALIRARTSEPGPPDVTVLADTSAWVEFDRATGSRTHLRLRELIQLGEVATTEPLQMDVLR